jgi:tripartite-type tricarboxylate transporter receptor subunit TctC
MNEKEKCMHRWITRLALILVALSTLALATAQSFPSRNVNMMVPFNPGGGTDVLARIIQRELESIWGVSVVITNQAGAAGLVGTLSYLREQTDGHDILMASTGAILALASDTGGDGVFDIRSRLQPITQVSQPPYLVTVHPRLGITTMEELLAYAINNPGLLFYGSSGIGSASHLTGVLFEQLTGASMTHVPYTGMGAAGPALLSGEIDLLFAPAPTVQAYFDDGSLIPLAVTTPAPTSLFPNLPTVAETVPGFGIAGWFGLFGHPSIPAERIAQLNEAVVRAMANPAVIAAMANQGSSPVPMTPDEYTEFVNRDVSMWQELEAVAGD